MNIQIINYTPSPAVMIAGTVKSFGIEKISIRFGEGWKRLKKQITFFLSEDDSESITLDCKASPVKIPRELYENPGIYRYVVTGEGKNKKIVSRSGFLIVRSTCDDYRTRPPKEVASKKRGDR